MAEQDRGNEPPQGGNRQEASQHHPVSVGATGKGKVGVGQGRRGKIVKEARDRLVHDIRLGELKARRNQLTGEIPPELGNLPTFEHLYLSDNQLTGEIPAELGNPTNLRTLDLSNNKLSGSFPTFIADLPSLNTLELEGYSYDCMAEMEGYFESGLCP